ncbi:hypothetical protein ACJRO7_017229 [Eucalyptus globulus]|uniref:Uncharacterized protein n=1 Tax=Eucalyptus globulus TaxID=34317 RepID=A0ABD3KQT3_EUCGL
MRATAVHRPYVSSIGAYTPQSKSIMCMLLGRSRVLVAISCQTRRRRSGNASLMKTDTSNETFDKFNLFDVLRSESRAKLRKFAEAAFVSNVTENKGKQEG